MLMCWASKCGANGFIGQAGGAFVAASLGIVGLGLPAIAQKVQAQTTPPQKNQLPTQPQPRDDLPTPSLPEPLETPSLTVPPREVPNLPEGENIPTAVVVERFDFVGNTAFSDEVLTEVLQGFTNRPIAFAELLQAEAAVTQQYRDQGYVNSGAVILAGQTLDPEAAVVQIQVIEGGVEEIVVTGTERLKPSYVRQRLKRAIATPLNQQKLLEALQLLQLDPLIESISADLSASTRPELSVLTVEVAEAKSLDVEIFADNYRSPSVGSFQRGARLVENNVSGIGDRLSLSYSNTDGSNTANARVEVPINGNDGTVSLGVGGSLTRITELPEDSFDVTGRNLFVDLSYRQPIIRKPTQELALGVTASYQTSETQIDGSGLPNFPEGANSQSRTRISALRFFQDWTRRNPQDVIALRSQFNVGLDFLRATSNLRRNDPLRTIDRPDGRFFSWLGQAQYVRRLAQDSLLIGRTNLQLTPDNLLSEEEFSLGGHNTVRGFRQNLLQTDNGFSASLEAQFPILRVKSVDGLLKVAPFFDVGVAWNQVEGETPSPNTLAGVGVGLQWQMWQDRLTARFDWGIPLVDVGGDGKSLQEQGLYFSISYRP